MKKKITAHAYFGRPYFFGKILDFKEENDQSLFLKKMAHAYFERPYFF